MKTYSGGVGPLAPDIIAACAASNGFVIELGVFNGTSSTAMVQEALESHAAPLHISVDWDESNFAPEARPTVPWWHFVKGDTRNADTLDAVRAIAGDRKAGVIYIDTDHNGAQVKAELELWSAMADNETVWLFHDVALYGSLNVDMNCAIEEFAAQHGWAFDIPRMDSHGLGRMRR